MKADSQTEADVLLTLEHFNLANQHADVAELMALFAPDDDVLLLGSEAGEMASGRDELEQFFRRMLRRSGGYWWSWAHTSVSSSGTIAWLLALGTAHAGDDLQGVPYRLTVVLERVSDRWVWRQFHGSEPRQ